MSTHQKQIQLIWEETILHFSKKIIFTDIYLSNNSYLTFRYFSSSLLKNLKFDTISMNNTIADFVHWNIYYNYVHWIMPKMIHSRFIEKTTFLMIYMFWTNDFWQYSDNGIVVNIAMDKMIYC